MPMAAHAILALATACALALLPQSSGHAGHFHEYPDTPSGNNYVRFEIGNCADFVTLNTSSNLTMTGKVTVWLYAYQNCSDRISTALEFDTIITQSGQPWANHSTSGWAYTGTCAAPGSKYLQNASLGETPTNTLWWHEADTDAATGALHGNAANAIVIRSVDGAGAQQADAVRSVTVYTDEYGATLCCNLNMLPQPPVSRLLAIPGVEPCATGASPPPPGASANANSGGGGGAGSAPSVPTLLLLAAMLLAVVGLRGGL